MALQRIPIKKGRPIMLVVLLLLVIVLMVMVDKCSHHDPQADKNVLGIGDTINVAVEFSPLSYYISGDSVAGLDYEIMRGVGAVSGHPVKFHPVSSVDKNGKPRDLSRYNLLISPLPSTQAVKSQFMLTDAVYLDRPVLVQRRKSSLFIADAVELADDTVRVAFRSPLVERVENLGAEIGATVYIESPKGSTAESLVKQVSEGLIPRAVVNEGIARRMQQTVCPDIDFSTPVGFSQFQCWIIPANDSVFADSINSWLGRFKQTADYEAVLARYGY